jgi:hypothetical protein
MKNVTSYGIWGKKGELSRLLPVNLALIYYHRGWKIATLPGNLIK